VVVRRSCGRRRLREGHRLGRREP